MDGNLVGSGSLAIDIDATYTSDIQAFVDPANALIYNFETCIWPSSGRLDFDINHAGYRYRGYVDFGTGDCNTANVSLRGIETQWFLPDLFPQ